MRQATSEKESIVPIGECNGLQLAIKKASSKSLGKIIASLDSQGLIAGVQIEHFQVHPDDRGFFTELVRLGADGIGSQMVGNAMKRVQVSAALGYPGTIKAIHFHYLQTDLWVPIAGMLQVFLYDFRQHSETFGLINTLYIGQFRPWKILIPPGIGHGYKVLGTQPAQLVYLTDRYYNPEDEGRLPYDHRDIGYDWEIQHK